MDKKKRIKSVTLFYYTNRKIQEYLVEFGKRREVVPRYYESFGKRPDVLEYPTDVANLAKRGATSFHCSEELWKNPLELSTSLSRQELNALREGWDLLIDVDSPFLDCSRVATKLILRELLSHGISNFGVKFSGSKGFHILVSWNAFPKTYLGEKTSEMFPEWPRAICEYLAQKIRADYNREVAKLGISAKHASERLRVSEEELTETVCQKCGGKASKVTIAKFECGVCGAVVERKISKFSKQKLKCINSDCRGLLSLVDKKEHFVCESCGATTWRKELKDSFELRDAERFEEGVAGSKLASLDLVLVAPRHLFRMPYSLHEKTALASAVISPEELESFVPQMANPMKVKLREFYPANKENEARELLAKALEWKRSQVEESATPREHKKDFEFTGKVSEELFPQPIKKLLKGLRDGRKRALFVLVTFLRSLNFSKEEVKAYVERWNARNEPPLKEGYIRTQLEWHFKQRRKILPPNYSNESFYKDIGLLTSPPRDKNPISEVMRKLRSNSR
ncbi:hypothetical protein D6817_01135 [Candidatus Pacearchaeota archaeon]|nr:MAG: hypothetical protein D6817_01135 [Candidatus Pacearchaeota archaeon]